MSLPLPEPVAAYFAAHSAADCFAENAVVHDEGGTHQGRAAIRQWREETTSKYNFTSLPLSVERKDDECLVSARVSGNFPGSPLELKYSFRLTNDQIVELSIS